MQIMNEESNKCKYIACIHLCTEDDDSDIPLYVIEQSKDELYKHYNQLLGAFDFSIHSLIVFSKDDNTQKNIRKKLKDGI